MTESATLDTLYLLVTEAIQRAEALTEIQAPGAAAAHLDVSLLEERIAAILPASDPEGALARRGALRAAVSADDYERARLLAARFVAEDDASPELQELVSKLAPDESREAAAIERAPDSRPVRTTDTEHGVSSSTAVSAADARDVARLMSALATPGRVRILARLRRGGCTVGELAAAAEMEPLVVSHQLRILRDLGLVLGSRSGQHAVYGLYDSHVAALLDEVLRHIEHLRAGAAEPIPAPDIDMPARNQR